MEQILNKVFLLALTIAALHEFYLYLTVGESLFVNTIVEVFTTTLQLLNLDAK